MLRDATPGDLPALLDVQQAGAVLAFAHVFPQDTHPFPREEIQARWLREIADPGVAAYVAEHDCRIVGFAATRGDELLHFGTAIATWGTGLAGTVHDELMERLAAAGVTRARLRVLEENQRARRFYERRGWRPTGGRTRSPFPPHPVLLDYVLDL